MVGLVGERHFDEGELRSNHWDLCKQIWTK